MRRARYVAREYAWLESRADIFAPASSCLMNRLLLIHFVTSSNPDRCLVGIDVSDACLTVDQVVPARVVYKPVDGGPPVYFALGKVLPGQRDGSEKWYVSLTEFLGSSLNIEALESYPTLLRAPQDSVMQLHVDDILGSTTRKYAHETLKPTLESKYKIKFEVLSEPGDTIWFLKRKLHLISADQLLVTPHPKYVERLVDLLKVGGPGRKKTPLLAELEKISADSSQSLSEPHAKIFRQCVGILLYVATDYVDCQYTIGLLASKMRNPNQTAMKALRHLVSYMQGIVSEGILISNRGKHTGLLGNSMSHEAWVESFSDSNWAADQVTRKSTSAGCICVLGNVLHTSSRSQRVIALSSGEAELLASAGVLCDCMLVRTCACFAFYLDAPPPIIHHVDSTAALGALRRQGVGKIRHQQSAVKSGIVIAEKIATDWNVADLGTKGLSRARTLFLICLLHVYDSEEGAYVGEDEYASQLQRDLMKSAVRQLRQTGAAVSKQMIRQVVVAALLSTPVLAASNVSDALSLSPGAVRALLMLLVIFIACALQGCEPVSSVWGRTDWSQVVVTGTVILMVEMLVALLGLVWYFLSHRVTLPGQPEPEPCDSPASSMPLLESLDELDTPQPDDEPDEDGDHNDVEPDDDVEPDEDVGPVDDGSGVWSDDELANEPGRGSNDGPRAFEPEPLDGDFSGAQDQPLVLPGDVPDNFTPALDNDGGGNGQGPPLTNPIVVAGYGNNLVLQFHRTVHAGWYIAPVSGRRVHVYQNCDGLRRANRVTFITEEERVQHYGHLQMCHLCYLRVRHMAHRTLDGW